MRYIDDLLTLNNSGFACKIDDIYPPELQFKRTTECPATLSYLDLLITIDNGKYSTGNIQRQSLTNFPHMSSNIPAYGVYISQLVRIGRICSSFVLFIDRHYRLTAKLTAQGFGIHVCVWHLRSFHALIQVYSPNTNAVS